MEIEKGIPIPPAGPKLPRTERGRAVRALKVGESIFCPTEEEKERVRGCMVNAGIKYVTRMMDGGWRVWRVE